MAIRVDLADQAAAEAVLSRIRDPDFAASVERRTSQLAADHEALAGMVADALMGTSQDAGDGILWRDGRLSGRAWRKLKRELEVRATAVDCELGRQSLLARQREICASALEVGRSWDRIEVHEKRRVISSVVDHFVVAAASGVSANTASQRLNPVWQGEPTSCG